MKWKTLETKEILKSSIVTIEVEKCELPDGRIMPNYYVMRFPDWVNIVPVTKDKEIILISQYRQATRKIHWEIPGGAAHRGEDPAVAAEREMLEETGYRVGRLLPISQHYPNPALQDNLMHTYLALDCEKVADQKLDPFEDIRVETFSIKKFKQMAASGEIDHSIVIASIFHCLEYIDHNDLNVF